MISEKILGFLPERVKNTVLTYNSDIICEIRLRAGRNAVITTPSANIPTDVTVTEEELSEAVSRICGGSLHSYEETIKNGYLPLPEGGRAGVCGTFSGGTVRDITSVCIRIPRNIKGAGRSLCRRLITEGKGGGMLIYSPPGEGKTTLLRDIAVTLSSPPYLRRVAVIDSREEIYRKDSFALSSADIYLGYPKAYGIELATRTMSPQYIVCDELGHDEAFQILKYQSRGIPLICTAHSDSLEGLLSRSCFSSLHKEGIFSFYVGIKRMGVGYSFEITDAFGKEKRE